MLMTGVRSMNGRFVFMAGIREEKSQVNRFQKKKKSLRKSAIQEL